MRVPISKQLAWHVARRLARPARRLVPVPHSVYFNADDFGLTDGITAGILDAMQRGVVRGTTAMVCASGALERIARWADAVPGRIGLHLQLTTGAPVSAGGDVPSLVGDDGRFPGSTDHLARAVPSEVLLEWRAQVRALRSAGVEPSHLDAHHHVMRFPSIGDAYLRLAAELKVPARAGSREQASRLERLGVPCASATIVTFHGANATLSHLLDALCVESLRSPHRSTIEVMCHPGYADQQAAHVAAYVDGRAAELDLLCSGELTDALHRHGFAIADSLLAGERAGDA